MDHLLARYGQVDLSLETIFVLYTWFEENAHNIACVRVLIIIHDDFSTSPSGPSFEHSASTVLYVL